MRYRFGVLTALGMAAALIGGVYFARDYSLANEEFPLTFASWIAFAIAVLGAMATFSGIVPLRSLDDLEQRLSGGAIVLLTLGYIVGGWTLLVTVGMFIGWLRGAELSVALIWGVTILAAASACCLGGWVYAGHDVLTQPLPGYTIVEKSCGNCHASVPSNLGVGSSCPHCGAIWGREEKKKQAPWWERLFSI